MSDFAFVAGCGLIAFSLTAVAKSLKNQSVSHDFIYDSLYQITASMSLWHKVKHESTDYYTPVQRDQDSSQVRGDDAGSGSSQDS